MQAEWVLQHDRTESDTSTRLFRVESCKINTTLVSGRRAIVLTVHPFEHFSQCPKHKRALPVVLLAKTSNGSTYQSVAVEFGLSTEMAELVDCHQESTPSASPRHTILAAVLDMPRFYVLRRVDTICPMLANFPLVMDAWFHAPKGTSSARQKDDVVCFDYESSNQSSLALFALARLALSSQSRLQFQDVFQICLLETCGVRPESRPGGTEMKQYRVPADMETQSFWMLRHIHAAVNAAALFGQEQGVVASMCALMHDLEMWPAAHLGGLDVECARFYVLGSLSPYSLQKLADYASSDPSAATPTSALPRCYRGMMQVLLKRMRLLRAVLGTVQLN